MIQYDEIDGGTFTCWSCLKLRDHQEKAENWDITGKCKYCREEHIKSYSELRNEMREYNAEIR